MGKSRTPWLRAGLEEYSDRLKRYCRLEIDEVAPPKNAASLPRKVLREREGEALLSGVGEAVIVLLDAGGRQRDSEDLARWISVQQDSGVRALCFLVGGAYGFSAAVRHAARHSLSLSSMTFTHQLVRLVFVEQLYRAYTIIHGEPYHHG